MNRPTPSPTPRRAAVAALGLLLAGTAAAVPRAASPARQGAAVPQAASPARHGAAGPLTAARAAAAARTCAVHATAAGWANNGYYGGSLVTATAICMAESGGEARIYHCESGGADGYYPPVRCPGGSYDRGLWQLNSSSEASVPDSCAFRAQCNADAAYRISAAGTSFSPWAVYDDGSYTRYLAAAQAAVSGLRSGTVTSALFGLCLARSQEATGVTVSAGRCGRHTFAQRWVVTGGALRSGRLCLAMGRGSLPAVTLAVCQQSASVTWRQRDPGELRNAATGDCLTDPAPGAAPAPALAGGACTGSQAQIWWLP
jgi:hypothetical protein